MPVSPTFITLMTAVAAPNISASRLVRAAQVIAGATRDEIMQNWCRLELNGYPTIPVPECRKAAAQMKGVDRWGRTLSVRSTDPAFLRAVAECPIFQSLDEVEQYASNIGATYQVNYPPEQQCHLLESMPGAVEVFRLIQANAFVTVLNGARQHVSNWASDNLNTQVDLPSGFSIESVLGLPACKPTDMTSEPSIEVGGGIRFNNADLSRATLVIQSPGATATATHTTMTTPAVDVEALRDLVKLVTKKISELQAAGHPASEFAAVEEPLNELRELGLMPTPKPGWVIASLNSLKTVLEGAAGSVVGELAKPHVLVLVANLLGTLGR